MDCPTAFTAISVPCGWMARSDGGPDQERPGRAGAEGDARYAGEVCRGRPSEDGTRAAKQNLIGGFPLRVSSNAQIVEYIAMMGFYDYPLDWLDTLTGKLAAVDVAQVRDAFRRRISAPAGIAVIVGGNG